MGEQRAASFANTQMFLNLQIYSDVLFGCTKYLIPSAKKPGTAFMSQQAQHTSCMYKRNSYDRPLSMYNSETRFHAYTMYKYTMFVHVLHDYNLLL